VPTSQVQPSDSWGKCCSKFLTSLRAHPSRASGGYYYKTHLDYFSKMSCSLHQISSTLRDGGTAVLVIQDSYYKDLHNDLPSIVTEMAAGYGLQLKRRDDFRLARTLADINPRAQAYQKKTGAVEAVLCFRKE